MIGQSMTGPSRAKEMIAAKKKQKGYKSYEQRSSEARQRAANIWRQTTDHIDWYNR